MIKKKIDELSAQQFHFKISKEKHNIKKKIKKLYMLFNKK